MTPDQEQPAGECEHEWRIWPETDGQEQRCVKCGIYRRTPEADKFWIAASPAPTPAEPRCTYPHCVGDEPADRACCRAPFTSAMADAAERYWRTVGPHAHPLPAQFRWVECYRAMLDAAPTPADAAPPEPAVMFCGVDHTLEQIRAEQGEREAFEAVMARNGYHLSPARYRDGTYRDTAYAAAWIVWQEARARQASPLSEARNLLSHALIYMKEREYSFVETAIKDALAILAAADRAARSGSAADDVLEALDLDPEKFRTEGGAVNRGKLRAALLHPADYVPECHWLRTRATLADERNAARYRWLQEHTVATGLSRWMGRHQFLDAAIDAAISKEQT
jgi:hypothetical protein